MVEIKRVCHVTLLVHYQILTKTVKHLHLKKVHNHNQLQKKKQNYEKHQKDVWRKRFGCAPLKATPFSLLIVRSYVQIHTHIIKLHLHPYFKRFLRAQFVFHGKSCSY